MNDKKWTKGQTEEKNIKSNNENEKGTKQTQQSEEEVFQAYSQFKNMVI
jgi:hypothetical protein